MARDIACTWRARPDHGSSPSWRHASAPTRHRAAPSGPRSPNPHGKPRNHWKPWCRRGSARMCSWSVAVSCPPGMRVPHRRGNRCTDSRRQQALCATSAGHQPKTSLHDLSAGGTPCTPNRAPTRCRRCSRVELEAPRRTEQRCSPGRREPHGPNGTAGSPHPRASRSATVRTVRSSRGRRCTHAVARA